MGEIDLKEGYYAYVGSALLGIEQRTKRHLRGDKKHHWHIDYLSSKSSVRESLSATTSEKVECDISKSLSESFESVKDFGCSDCRCDSHLFYSKNEKALRLAAARVMQKIGLEPRPFF